MRADLAENLQAARVVDLRETATGAMGTLALLPRGVARVVAAVRGAELRIQAQLLPARPDEAGWRAAEAFLAAMVAQVEGVALTAGIAREEDVAWLQVEGTVADAPRLTLVLATVARAALGRANALLSEPGLAAAYLRTRRGETPGDEPAGEGGDAR